MALLPFRELPPASPWNAQMLNRSDVIGRPRKPFCDWLRAVARKGTESEVLETSADRQTSHAPGSAVLPAVSFDVRALGSRNLFHLRSDVWKKTNLFPDFAPVLVMPPRGRLRSTVFDE